MKNKIANLLKFTILIVCLSIFFYSCENDSLIEQTTNNNLKISTTSLNEINLNNSLKTTINSFKSVLDISKIHSKSSKNSNTITILTDSIVKIETEFATSYTFKILTPTSATSDFETFVIEERNNKIQLYVQRYFYVGGQKEYPYNIGRLNVDSETLNNANIEYQEKNSYSKLKDIYYNPTNGCYYDVHESGAIGLIGCDGTGGTSGGGNSSGGGDSSGEGSSSGGGFTGNDGGYFGDTNDSNESNGSNGGSGTTSNTSNSNTSYSVPLFIPYEEQIIDCLGSYILNSGNTTVNAWLNDPNTDPTKIKKVASFLKASSSNSNDPYNSNTETNCSNPEAIEFVVKAIEAWIDNCEVDFENGIIIDKTFKNTKTKCIYDKLKSSSSFYKNMLSNFNG